MGLVIFIYLKIKIIIILVTIIINGTLPSKKLKAAPVFFINVTLKKLFIIGIDSNSFILIRIRYLEVWSITRVIRVISIILNIIRENIPTTMEMSAILNTG